MNKFITLGFLGIAAGTVLACSSTQQNAEVASSSCTPDGDMSEAIAAFYEPGSVTKATAIEKAEFRARALPPKQHTMGASLYVRAEKNMSAPYLHRALSCHASSGKSAHPNDPLHPEAGAIAKLSVREAGGHFAVDVVARDSAVGEEILQRAEALSSSGGSVQVEQVGALVSDQTNF